MVSGVVHLSNPAGIANLKAWQPSELGPALFGSVLLLGGAFLHGSVPLAVLGLAWAYGRAIQHGVEP